MTAAGGIFVAVVGPSGAGKDSLLSAARARLADDPRFVFARRIITREADHTEDHDSVDAQVFNHLRESGALALSWEAHDLSYGLPAILMDELERERVVIANVSRAVLPLMRKTFARSCVIQITASEDVLRQRLASRGRETVDAQQDRLARTQMLQTTTDADITITNDGAFEDACQRFVAALTAACPVKADAHAGPGP